MRQISQAKANACAWFWPMKTFVASFRADARGYKGPRLWRTTPGPTEAHKVHLGTLSCASSALDRLQWRPRLWPTAPGQTEAYESKLRTPNAPFSALDRSLGGGKQARGGGTKQGNKPPRQPSATCFVNRWLGGGRGGLHNRGAPGRHRMPHEASRTGTQIKETEKYRV